MGVEVEGIGNEGYSRNDKKKKDETDLRIGSWRGSNERGIWWKGSFVGIPETSGVEIISEGSLRQMR